jgi:hypothetical protein
MRNVNMLTPMQVALMSAEYISVDQAIKANKELAKEAWQAKTDADFKKIALIFAAEVAAGKVSAKTAAEYSRLRKLASWKLTNTL